MTPRRSARSAAAGSGRTHRRSILRRPAAEHKFLYAANLILQQLQNSLTPSAENTPIR